MNSHFTISIIIPVFNAEKTLNRCLDSVIRQTYSNLQIIIVNNNSTDKSKEIIQRYLSSDERICYVEEQEKGVSYARNRGLEMVSGEYIMFVDSDDFIEPTICEILLDSIIENKTVMSLCLYNRIFEKRVTQIAKSDVSIVSSENIDNAFQYLYSTGLIKSPWGKLFCADYVNSYNGKIRYKTNLNLGEDQIFNLEVLSQECTIAINNEYLYNYCDTDESLTNTFSLDTVHNLGEVYWRTIEILEKQKLDKDNIQFVVNRYPKAIFKSLDNLYLAKLDKKTHNLYIKEIVKSYHNNVRYINTYEPQGINSKILEKQNLSIIKCVTILRVLAKKIFRG